MQGDKHFEKKKNTKIKPKIFKILYIYYYIINSLKQKLFMVYKIFCQNSKIIIK